MKEEHYIEPTLCLLWVSPNTPERKRSKRAYSGISLPHQGRFQTGIFSHFMVPAWARLDPHRAPLKQGTPLAQVPLQDLAAVTLFSRPPDLAHCLLQAPLPPSRPTERSPSPEKSDCAAGRAEERRDCPSTHQIPDTECKREIPSMVRGQKRRLIETQPAPVRERDLTLRNPLSLGRERTGITKGPAGSAPTCGMCPLPWRVPTHSDRPFPPPLPPRAQIPWHTGTARQAPTAPLS